MDINNIFFLILILISCLLIYIPKKIEGKAIKKMQEELKINDKVITYTGLTGTILEIIDEQVVLQTFPDNVKLNVEKWAIAGIDTRNLNK